MLLSARKLWNVQYVFQIFLSVISQGHIHRVLSLIAHTILPLKPILFIENLVDIVAAYARELALLRFCVC